MVSLFHRATIINSYRNAVAADSCKCHYILLSAHFSDIRCTSTFLFCSVRGVLRCFVLQRIFLGLVFDARRKDNNNHNTTTADDFEVVARQGFLMKSGLQVTGRSTVSRV